MIRAVYSIVIRWRDPLRFVCVTDLDEGMSVTNDIENVIADLLANGHLHRGDRLIYRDSMGIWDEAVIDDACHFIDYRSLGGAKTCNDAIARVLELREANQ